MPYDRDTFRLASNGNWEKVPFYSLQINDFVKFVDRGKRVKTKDGKQFFRILTNPEECGTLEDGTINYLCQTQAL